MRGERVDLELAEGASEIEMLLGGDLLVAEEEDLVVEQRVTAITA
jgi:hypothetical protein